MEAKLLQFEVDAGAACSLITDDKYHEMQNKNALRLSSKLLDFHTWSGEKICILGSAQIQIKFK